MATDTGIILKSILQNFYRIRTLEDARKSIEVLLDKEDVALIREQTPEYAEIKKQEQKRL